MRARWKRVLSSRVTLLVSVVVFILSLVMLPIQDYSPSCVGQWIYDRMHSGMRLFQPRPLDRSYFVHHRGQLVYLHPDQELPPQYDRGKAVRFTFWYFNQPFGWWAPTEIHEDMRIEYFYDALELATRDEIIKTYVEHLVKKYPFVSSFSDELLASGKAQRVSTRWLGWFHNAVSLVSLLFLVVSTPLVTRSVYRSRVSRKGMCPNCRYDRAGLPAEALCPECGSPSTVAI